MHEARWKKLRMKSCTVAAHLIRLEVRIDHREVLNKVFRDVPNKLNHKDKDLTNLQY